MISKNLIKLVKSLEQKKYRRREQLFVAEGPKVVHDLMAISEPKRIIHISPKRGRPVAYGIALP